MVSVRVSPRRRTETVRSATSFMPMARITGTLPTECSPHLVVDLFIARIGFGPHPCGFERIHHLIKRIGIRDDGCHHHLTRGQPERQFAGNSPSNADEPLKAAQNGAVQHIGAVFRAIYPDIFRIQPVWQVRDQPVTCRIAILRPIASVSLKSSFGP